jgi:Holliday junction resolvase RusA-like endonuclease
MKRIKSEQRVTAILTLPFPPTTNHAYATVNSRRVKTKEAKSYAAFAASLAKAAYVTEPFNTSDRLEVELILHAPDRRRYDIMNREKILIDAIAQVLGFDDQQIDFFTITRGHHDANDPRAIVIIQAVRPTSDEQVEVRQEKIQPGRKK